MYCTSYFGNVNALPKNAILISISLWSPRGWRGKHIKQLAPTEDILREYQRDPNIARYCDRFQKEVLAGHDPKKLDKAIRERWGDGDVFFLCYEKPNKFCHRRLVAKWMEDSGFSCPEWLG